MARKTLKDAILDAWDALIPLVGLNIVWFIFTVLILTAIPAFGGLYYATHKITHGESGGVGTFFEGFKKYFWTSWKWGLFSLLIYGLLFMNIWFYGQFEGTWFFLLQSLFASSVLIFTCVHIYIYPFLLEQDQPVLKNAIRNSFAAFIKYMGRTFLILLFFVVLSVVSVFLPPLWLLLTMSLVLYLANWQTRTIIFEIRQAEIEKTKAIEN